jgi:hypothetical protein
MREPSYFGRCSPDVRTFVVAVVIAALVSCTSQEVAPSVPPAAHAPTVSEKAPCPVTLPDGSHRAGDPAGLGDLGYGNGPLWVALWPKGRARATEDNVNRRGEIVMKFPWDRGVRGHLHISGRRIDAGAPPLRVHLSDYGLAGFQATALVFPTEGCWEVTGSIRHTDLTFVTRVTLSS